MSPAPCPTPYTGTKHGYNNTTHPNHKSAANGATAVTGHNDHVPLVLERMDSRLLSRQNVVAVTAGWICSGLYF